MATVQISVDNNTTGADVEQRLSAKRLPSDKKKFNKGGQQQGSKNYDKEALLKAYFNI